MRTSLCLLTVAAAGLSLAACGTSTGERSLSGAGIGAGIGAAAGAATGGDVVKGAIVGAAAGAATGALTNERDINLDPNKRKKPRR